MWKRLDSQLWCYNAPLRCSLQWKYVWTQPRPMKHLDTHQLPRENVSTMSSAIVGHNISSVDILLTFIYFYANVMSWHYWTILMGLGPSFTTPYHIIVTKWVSWTIPADDPDHNILFQFSTTKPFYFFIHLPKVATKASIPFWQHMKG